MKLTEFDFHGVFISAYAFEAGEVIPWHSHPKPHGHLVVRGKTKVEIENEPSFEMEIGIPNKELPPNIQHQITALESGTVFLHISLGKPNEI